MSNIKITVGNKEYDVEVVTSQEDKSEGLQNRENLPENKGMLFVFDSPQEVSMWMKDTLIPLDIVFIDDELTVGAIEKGVPLSEEMLTYEGVNYVLEVNQGSGIEIGDDVTFHSGKTVKKEMLVLDENGNPQMTLEGGERIFSRNHTKILIKFAKKADYSGKDSDYKTLGKKIFKFLDTQNTQEAEYVEKKK